MLRTQEFAGACSSSYMPKSYLVPELIVFLVTKQVKRVLNFGDGRRICIGMPLAKLILPTNLALLLSNFSFRLADKVCSQALLLL